MEPERDVDIEDEEDYVIVDSKDTTLPEPEQKGGAEADLVNLPAQALSSEWVKKESSKGK